MNCQDCAGAVATLGNLLGADLVELTIGPGPALNFPVRDVVPIGEQKPRSTSFATHAVAAKMGRTARETIVYDACVGFGPEYRPIVGMPLDEYLLKLTDPGAAVVDLASGARRRVVATPIFHQRFQ